MSAAITAEEWLERRVDQAIAEAGPFKDAPRDAVMLMFESFRQIAERFHVEAGQGLYEAVETVMKLWELGFLVFETDGQEGLSFRLSDGSKGIVERMAENKAALAKAESKRQKRAAKRLGHIRLN